jgi:16S rRNA (guanine527-N7)-methyltransferase
LGEVPLETHIEHALGFADAAGWVPEPDLKVPGPGPPPAMLTEGPWLDLGSGGGIPGLVLAHRWPDREAVLLDSNERRTAFLSQVVGSQGWGDRVRVVTGRAEVVGRAEGRRGAFSLVVARSFGPPPVTAECAAPFLRRGGVLIVSEPPGSDGEAELDPDRWPEEGLHTVGLARLGLRRGQFGYAVLRQTVTCPERFPRRVGVPGKRPIYRTGPG